MPSSDTLHRLKNQVSEKPDCLSLKATSYCDRHAITHIKHTANTCLSFLRQRDDGEDPCDAAPEPTAAWFWFSDAY